jgi:hypothetical protein
VRVSHLSVDTATRPKPALAEGASDRPPAPSPAPAPARPSAPAPPPAVLNLRREVLQALRGPEPLTPYQVPCRWPVMRVHVLAVVRALHAEGLLERLTTPATGNVAAYRATAAGRALVAGRGPILYADHAGRPAPGTPSRSNMLP